MAVDRGSDAGGGTMPACVSVIVPARNASATIGATLGSLAADRTVIREILLIDDGSMDGTASVAAAAGRRSDLPLTVIEAEFRNAGACRNVGIARATGDFLYFLDADDEVMAGGLGRLVACLHSNPGFGAAIGGYVRRTDGRMDKTRLPGGYKRDRLANACNYLRNKLHSVAVGSALVRRNALGDIRYPETLQYDEDTFFWAMILTRTDVVTVRRLVMIYNVVDERFIHRFTSSARGELMKVAIELRRLRAFGIEDDVLKWRKGWLARRVARAFLMIGDPVSARKFMRMPAAHPALRHSPATLRYAMRIRLAAMWRSAKDREGTAPVRRRAAPR